MATITNDFDFYWISAGCLCLFAACGDSPESDDWQKAGARTTGDQQGQYCRSCGSWQESWFLTGVTQLVLSDSGVSVQWECCRYHDSCQEAWSVYGLESLDVVMYTLSIQQTHTRCCHIHVHVLFSTNPHSMLWCTCSLFNKPIFDVVKLLISIVFSYVLLLDFVSRHDSHILLGFPKINV